MKRKFSISIFFIAIILMISGCDVSQQEITLSTPLPSQPETPERTTAPSQTATSEPTSAPLPTEEESDFVVDLMVDGLERSYLLHIPPGLDDQQPLPVVFAFHGYNVNPKGMQTSSQFDEVADQEKFIVVYPFGVVFSWNSGSEYKPHYGSALADNVDDVGFTKQILSDLESRATIDPKRVYAMGFSQGGFLVYRLGCEMADTFAAIAAVSANHLFSNCEPTEPVSVIHIHGLKDTSELFAGGGKFEHPPVIEGIELWADLNNCTDSREEKNESQGITHITYEPCNAGTSVELYTTDSGIHNYARIGIPTTEIIWDFFQSHPKP